jgi:hypothetical protein
MKYILKKKDQTGYKDSFFKTELPHKGKIYSYKNCVGFFSTQNLNPPTRIMRKQLEITIKKDRYTFRASF